MRSVLRHCVVHLNVSPLVYQFSNYQSINLYKTTMSILKDLQLADLDSNDDIKLLIGSDFYWYVVMGNIKISKIKEPVGVVLIKILVMFYSQKTEQLTKIANLENELQFFWDLEI